MPKVSVIVPVYGAEKYVSRCIDSILNQTYSNWELILVDDGSPDRSGAICDEYVQRDSRIKVIHKTNGGVSSARNLGLDEAQGEWVTFVDADDWLCIDTFNICLPYLVENDIVRFSMNRVLKEDGTDNRPFRLVEEPKEQYLARIVSRETILGVCGGLYRRTMFSNNDIRFDTSLISGEDWVVLTNLVVHANSCKILSQPLYQYNKYNEGSCTATFKYKTHFSNICALNQVAKIANNFAPLCNFTKACSIAKCDLVYDFEASRLVNHASLLYMERENYNKTARLSLQEIVQGHSNVKQLLLLLSYWLKTKFPQKSCK